MMMRILLLALGCIAAGASAQDDMANRIVNKPAEVSVYGTMAKVRQDAKVQGGSALRIDNKGKPNAWDIGVTSVVDKPVKAGDNLILAFYARLEKGPDGAKSVTLPYNAIQLSSAPYTPVVQGTATVGPEWELHQVKGKADKDYAAGALGVGIHLAAQKQVIDLGPVIVLDMGQ